MFLNHLDNLVESLPSPGSESSGVSSLDAEDAKVRIAFDLAV